ncbi:hypothetical protein [Cognatiyoonia sp. IB215182]|uniref:hypothetical protein n=1 Tax=Cognatiyoonia sp. IB215182 TaxID=3097353 RepID=UPI002A103F57|nr:hypothetical protein [Cognatiyoonia sp. IB215182]MDX8355103.1 hypothetical protein [Cognatiyoonia sp. IB215182]
MQRELDQERKSRVLRDGIPHCILVGGFIAGLLYFAGVVSQDSSFVWFGITWVIIAALAFGVWSTLVAKFFKVKQHVERKIAQLDIDADKSK